MSCISDLSNRNREVNNLSSNLQACNTEKTNLEAKLTQERKDLEAKLTQEKKDLEAKLTQERDLFKTEKDSVTQELSEFKDKAKADQDKALEKKDSDFKELLGKKDNDFKELLDKKDNDFKELLDKKDTDLKSKDDDLKKKDEAHTNILEKARTEAAAAQLKAETDMQKKCFHVVKDQFFNSRISDQMSAFLQQRDANGNFNVFDGTQEDFVRINMGDQQKNFIPQALSEIEKKMRYFSI